MSTMNPNENRVSSTSISVYDIIYLNMAKKNLISWNVLIIFYHFIAYARNVAPLLVLGTMAANPTFVRLPP
jgi:hypothetical protein